jgi:hypothetical protein
LLQLLAHAKVGGLTTADPKTGLVEGSIGAFATASKKLAGSASGPEICGGRIYATNLNSFDAA